MAKKIGIVLLVLFLLFLVAIAALPLWMPWAAGPILKRAGVEYELYERVGYGRFALHELSYSTDRLEVEAEEVEAYGPTAWLWRRWRGAGDVDFVAVDDWRVEIEEAEEDEDAGEDVSVYDILSDVEKSISRAIDWAPRATLGKGEVRAMDRLIQVRGGTWREGLLEATAFDEQLEQEVHVTADAREGLPFVMQGQVQPLPLSIDLTVSRVEDGVAVAGEAQFAGNPVVADAKFPREGYWPERAEIRADDFSLPSRYLQLEGYGDIAGSLLLLWREGRYTAELLAEAEPLEADEPFPPFRVEASANGDLESVLVEALEISSPWMVATLSDPVELDYGGELLSETSVFRLTADLSRQPFVELRGAVEGEVRIFPGDQRLPRADYYLEGKDIAGFDLEAEKVSLDGDLQWPWITLNELVVQGPGDARVEASGRLDFDAMTLAEGRAEGTIWPELVARWVPEGMSFSGIRFSGNVEGPVSELRHGGRVEAEDVVLPSIHPMDGKFVWEGQMEDVSEFSVELLAGAGRMNLEGTTEIEAKGLELVLRKMRLERKGEPLLVSRSESRLVLDWEKEPLLVSLDQLHWLGEESEVETSAEVAWPARGRFSGYMRGISQTLLMDFLNVAPGAFSLREARVEGEWDGGPVEYSATGKVRVDVEGDEVFFEVDAKGAREELRIERLRATSRGEALAVAEGALPLAIRPEHDTIFFVPPRGEFNFQARTEPRAGFWELIRSLTGVHLEDPSLSLELTGTPRAPAGQLVGSAALIDLRKLENTDRKLPVLEDLRIETLFDVDRLHLNELSLLVEGQRVEAEATLPMGVSEWQMLIEEQQLPDWARASGRFEIPGAEAAAFSRFAPDLLSPQGTIRADVEFLPEGQLSGTVTMEDMATRPLLPFGSIQEGTVRVALEGRTAHVEEVSAVVGGERLTVTGTVDIPFEQALAFDLKVQGSNLPLARRPGVVIRGDLDLSARKSGDETPIIAGRVDLHDSFYLAHLRVMPTGSVTTPERRPPFFSITQEPLADWRLNVDLRGPGFLNVRGPVFQGEVSASFNLSGTLEEPRAIGSATIDSGRVRFPFASMSIEQGEIALRREDPFQPQLFIVASSMAFGYDLRMEVTGTAEKPIIEFMANPPLTSEQALLMVTTGELPRDEIRFTTQQRASRFAIYIGQNLLYEITGDDAAGDRLTIRSGEHVSEGGRETMSIEYRLSDRWSVLGEYDRFDEYNAGLKWNIYSR